MFNESVKLCGVGTAMGGMVFSFWYTRALQEGKGSGKTKRITLETYVGSVHFLGREESEQF